MNVTLSKSLAIVLAMATITFGCTSQRIAPDTATEVINVPLSFLSVSGDSMPMNERPKKWIATLGAVSGGIFGAARYPPRAAKDLGSASTVSFRLSELQTELDQQSATITVGAAKAGWRIEPAETRFARLGTSFAIADKNLGPFAAGLADSVSKNILFIVFFDRPCRLTGTVVTPENGATTYTIDATIEKAGLNWLEVTKEGTNRRITKVGVPSHFLYVVQRPTF
jgi:hypothetical protein